MTRETAIEVLRKNRPGADPRRCGLELCTAVDVAIAALRELEKLESNLKVLESSGWISVEERLPAVNQRVLVWCESRMLTKHITVSTYMTTYSGTRRTYFSRRVRKVTHWMPLPEPPEEGDDGKR